MSGGTEAEGNPAVAAAEHRLDPVRGRRDDRQAVGPAALEHLLDVVGAGRDRDRGRQLRVDRGLGRASGLEQRLGSLRDREPGTEERSRLRDESRQGRVVPAGHTACDHPGAIDEDRRRYRDEPVGARRPVRRVLGGHPRLPAETARHPDGDLERVLEHGGGSEPGLLPGPAQWAQPAQSHRGGGALLRDEQQQRAAARSEAGHGHLGRAETADRQSRRAPRLADPTGVAFGHRPALPQPPRSAEGPVSRESGGFPSAHGPATLLPRSLAGVREPGEVPRGQDHGRAEAAGRDRVAAVADDREQQRVTPAGQAGDRPDGQAGSATILLMLYQRRPRLAHRGMQLAAK